MSTSTMTEPPALPGQQDDETSLIETLLADQRLRSHSGIPLPVEDYLDRHPILVNNPAWVVDLIDNERTLRKARGDTPSPDEYLARFPDLADQLGGLLDEQAETDPDLDDSRTNVSPPSMDADLKTNVAPPSMDANDPATNVAPPSVAPSSPAPRIAPSSIYPALEGYEILGVLGRGGMGVVYRARDHRRGVLVAIKTMRETDPHAIARFKQEFRALLDVSHTNLVTLHELISDGQAWFIVMELVDGINFLDYVRDGPNPQSADPATIDDALSPAGQARLRGVLRQLAEGLVALHGVGKLHRDIKPSNVLVTRQGRLVLMDFGLVTSSDEVRDASSAAEVVGTAAYMAPEQAANGRVAPPCDWYSVGVMLYEALTGMRPFSGHPLKILMDKQTDEPPPPGVLSPGLPDDLETLCVDLLRRDPADRPTGPDVLARLGVPEAVIRADFTPSPGQPGENPFVGRESYLAELAEALARVAAGRTEVVFIQGRSGLGKSALVRRFVDGLEVRGHDGAVVLTGRCYEREAVPYKALDGLIDSLARHLRRLPAHEVAALLPRDVGPLAQVFPVLRRVDAVATSPRRTAEVPDPQELRRRAYSALRELLARLGDRTTLVLSIDDLQWGDPDSLNVLAEIFRPPDPPVLLLIACYRNEEVGENSFLRSALEIPAASGLAARTLALGPLSADEAQSLARQLLAAGGTHLDERAGAVAMESGGSPLFVAELARSAAAGESAPADGPITLDEVLWTRIARLPAEAKSLLEVIAVAGGPMRPALAWECLGGEGDERATLTSLRVGRLVRGARGQSDGEWVETYHDRVRETVVAHLDPATLKGQHRRLALTLEAAQAADHETLGIHFRGADEPRRAGEHFARAAAQAAQALAFGRASSLYRLALDLNPPPVGQPSPLRAALADALANDGRGADAARGYLAACDGLTVAQSLEFRRKAAMQFLISGHIEQGLKELRDVLADIGMALPRTPRRALASLLLRRAMLRIRGLNFRPRDANQIAPGQLTRIDVCWSAGIGLSNVDWIRGADFQARGLLLALRAGEPDRIARALAVEAAQTATAGLPARKRTAQILSRAESLAAESGQPYANGMVALAHGVSGYLEGRWRDGLDGCDRAEGLFRDHCTGVTWELDTAHAYAMWALSHLGEWAELNRRFPVLIAEARDRGDLYAAMNLSTYTLSIVRLAADEPELARGELERVMSLWTGEGYHVQHNDQVWALTQVDLYLGNGPAAWARLQTHWPTLSGSLLMRVQFIRIAMLGLRARCALAASRSDASLRKSADRGARRLARERHPWADAQSRMILAGLAASGGDPAGALRDLGLAADSFRACGMSLHAEAVAVRRTGELLGGSQGQARLNAADALMAAESIRRPDRIADLFAPGFPAG
ncbi:protein kinase [Isosphaeraceae bacterium EP7]